MRLAKHRVGQEAALPHQRGASLDLFFVSYSAIAVVLYGSRFLPSAARIEVELDHVDVAVSTLHYGHELASAQDRLHQGRALEFQVGI